MKLGNKILLVSLKSIFLPSLGMTLVLIDRLKFYCPFTLISCNPRPSKYILCVCRFVWLILFQVFYKGVYLAYGFL